MLPFPDPFSVSNAQSQLAARTSPRRRCLHTFNYAAETLLIKCHRLPRSEGPPDYHGSNQIYPKECPAKMTAMKRWALFSALTPHWALCARSISANRRRNHRAPPLCPSRDAHSTEGWYVGGGGWQRGPYRPHSLLLRATGSHPKESHFQLMALQGPAICEMSWESQPSGFCCKAVPSNWAPPHQGCGVNIPKRPRAKCG